MISATRNVTAIADVRHQFDDVAIFGVPSSALATVLICGDPIWDHALGWLVSSAGLVTFEATGEGVSFSDGASFAFSFFCGSSAGTTRNFTTWDAVRRTRAR